MGDHEEVAETDLTAVMFDPEGQELRVVESIGNRCHFRAGQKLALSILVYRIKFCIRHGNFISGSTATIITNINFQFIFAGLRAE